MGMKIAWTDQAASDLEDIFDYYIHEASRAVALKITESIIMSVVQLENYPKSGQKEELLINKKYEYRYLVQGNYKIIYWIDDPLINIATVFDCRQNPTKMRLSE
jgi:plasmid stabilization system protein ParE